MPTGDLLSQARAALQDNDTALMQALALSCHGRMLELADTDRPLAVRHALSGADLLAALVAVEGPQPDWLAIHEEQCCRYGCLWIHELLQAGDPQALHWAGDALRLLARIEQLHPEPVDWAPVLRASLLQHQATAPVARPARLGPAAIADRRIVVVGNCQCHPLMLSLRQALPGAFIHFCPSVHLASSDDVRKLHQRLGSTDLLITHRIQPGYRNDIGLDTPTLRGLLQPQASLLVLPNLHYEGHHPFIAYAHDPDGRLACLEAESPLGTYHDFLTMAAAAQGLGPEALLQPAGDRLVAHLQQWHQRSIEELRQREQDCDIPISDWIEQVHRLQPLMHTINHPNQLCLDQMLRRLIRHLDPQLPLQDGLHDPHEHLGAMSIPIHPWVRQAFGLGGWALTWGQRAGQPFPIEQQLQESLQFYRAHSWIIDNNRDHPRLAVAQRLLNGLEPSQPTATTLAASPRRQPSLAALINHHDDVEMLAWQLRSGSLDPYDRIYIWDGPYEYCTQLGLGDPAVPALVDTPTGQQLLADPRVVIRQGRWRDEAAKRIEAYTAISEDLVVLHDTDEFFYLDREVIRQFWESAYDVGSHRVQNLYAGGLLGSDAHHRSNSASILPHKRIIFRRDRISPSQHLDYLWLVGVAQNPTDPSRLCPQPLGDTLHLTGCRSTRGQIGKMSFYKCLALSKGSADPVLATLRRLIDARELSGEQAVLLYLRGDPGFAGIPHPDFGLSLQPRFPDPRFPAELLEAILAESHQSPCGPYHVLEGYPLVLWFPAAAGQRTLQFTLAEPGQLQLRSWLWLNRLPAIPAPPLAVTSTAIELNLPAAPELMGTLIEFQIRPAGPSPRCQLVEVNAG